MPETRCRRSPFRPAVLALALALAGAIATAPLAAQATVGVRGGLYLGSADPFLGLEAVVPFQGTAWSFDPNVEIAFPDQGSLLTANLDFAYEIGREKEYSLWAGVGGAWVRRDPGDGARTKNDPGLNLFLGADWRRFAGVRPYAQLKLLLSNDSKAVLAVGVRF